MVAGLAQHAQYGGAVGLGGFGLLAGAWVVAAHWPAGFARQFGWGQGMQ